MDLEQAASQIDLLIERRASERSNADELEEMYAARARRHRGRERRENAALWYEYFANLAEAHASISAYFAARAEALLSDKEEGEA